jgi:hypothetical protein
MPLPRNRRRSVSLPLQSRRKESRPPRRHLPIVRHKHSLSWSRLFNASKDGWLVVFACLCGGGFAERTQSAQSQRDVTKPPSTTSTTATASASVPRPARVASATTTRPLFVPSINPVSTAAPPVPTGYATTSIKARGGPGTGYAAAPTAVAPPSVPNSSPTPAPAPAGQDTLWSPNPSAALQFVSPPPPAPAPAALSQQDAPLPTQRQLDAKSERRATAQVYMSARTRCDIMC